MNGQQVPFPGVPVAHAPVFELDEWRVNRPATPRDGGATEPPAGEPAQGWWVDIREALNYELDEQGDAARHVGCRVDPRPFDVSTDGHGTTLEAFLIAVSRHRNKCHAGRPE